MMKRSSDGIIQPVSTLSGVSGEQVITVDSDSQLLWVIHGADDWQPTIHVAAGVSCTLGVIVLGTGHLSTSLTLDVCLAPEASADVSVLACLVDGGRVSLDAAMRLQPGAQQSVGHLDTRTMLLGDDVSVRMTPGLDVRANDVVASHGARIDRIDGESLWYMMSRGIDRTHAQSLLVRAALVGMVGSVMDDTHDADIVVEESMELLGF